MLEVTITRNGEPVGTATITREAGVFVGSFVCDEGTQTSRVQIEADVDVWSIVGALLKEATSE